jgi:hypothetical protein
MNGQTRAIAFDYGSYAVPFQVSQLPPESSGRLPGTARQEREGAVSGDRSSVLRKRALRRLSHEHYGAYSALYEQVMSEIPGLTRLVTAANRWLPSVLVIAGIAEGNQ